MRVSEFPALPIIFHIRKAQKLFLKNILHLPEWFIFFFRKYPAPTRVIIFCLENILHLPEWIYFFLENIHNLYEWFFFRKYPAPTRVIIFFRKYPAPTRVIIFFFRKYPAPTRVIYFFLENILHLPEWLFFF